ncbi:MAG: hypothetical protein IJM24_02835 [Clostridia bacterium]|nr:hypothetical protein [Clostridia bacterium]
MKKIIALLLAMMMTAALVTVSFAEDQENLVGNFNPSDTNSALRMDGQGFDTIGSVFTTVGEATRIAFVCPSWSDNVGNLTVTLWKWDKDYQTTVAAAPLNGPEVFENFEDNSVLGFEFETPVAAGTYYLELSGAEDGTGVGVWSAQATYPGQAVLRDGEYVKKLSLRMYVDYVTEPEGARYGALPKLDGPKNELGCDDPNPYEVYFKMADYDLSDCAPGDQVEFEQNDDGTLHVYVPEGAFDCKYDLNFSNFFDVDDEISCKDYPYVAFRVKLANIEDKAGSGEIFMYTSSVTGATGGYSTAVTYDWANPDWQTVVADPTVIASFKKNAVNNEDVWLGFRFDVLNGIPEQDVEMDIDWIAFFGSEEAALAFDGDFAKAFPDKATAAPTEAPKPTDAPVVTDAPQPTDAPVVTEAPKPTDAPKATDAPKDDTKEKDEVKKDNKTTWIIVGVVAAVAVAAIVAGVIIAGSKKKKK